MAAMASDLGATRLALGIGGEEGNRGGDGVFLSEAELVVRMGEAEELGGGVFIGGGGRLPAARMFAARPGLLRASASHLCTRPGHDAVARIVILPVAGRR
jgi:hypothetical protein